MKVKIVFLIIILSLVNCTKSENTINGRITTNTDSLDKVEIITPTNNISGKISNIKNGCGYNYVIDKQFIELQTAGIREIDQIKTILNFTGIPMNFEFYSADIKNAVATIIDNKRYIIYDPNLFTFADQMSKSYWSSMSILAHEIGHHLSGHTLDYSNNNYKVELEADKFSGFILYKMGASVDDAISAMKNLGSEENSQTHPSKNKRIEAIKLGWNEANNQRFTSALPPPPNENLNYDEYDYNMLIDEKNLNEGLLTESDYADYDFFYGIIKDVTYDKTGYLVEGFKVHVKQTGPYWKENISNLNGDTIDISLEEYWNAKNSCQACYKSLPALITPGRRIKFAFQEGLYGGTSEGGWLRLTYIKALPGDSFK